MSLCYCAGHLDATALSGVEQRNGCCRCDVFAARVRALPATPSARRPEEVGKDVASVDMAAKTKSQAADVAVAEKPHGYEFFGP